MTSKNNALISGLVSGALRKTKEEGMMVSRTDASRALFLRPSQLPYCSLREFFRLPSYFSHSSSSDFSMSFYTRVGTAVHTVMQETLANALSKGNGRMFTLNDWVCRKCKHRHVLKRVIRSCRKCGHKFLYADEHLIDLPWLRGHIDTILVNDDVAVIIDWKTTSSKQVASKKGTEASYRAQIGTYCTIMKPVLAAMGIDLIGWALVYVARDNFAHQVVAGEDFVPMKQLKEWSRQHKHVMSLATAEEVTALVDNRICKTRAQNEAFDRWCHNRHVCLASGSQCQEHATGTLKKLKGRLPIKLHLKDNQREDAHTQI